MIPEIYYQLGARLNEFLYKIPLIEEYLLILQEIFTPKEAEIAVKLPSRPTSLAELSSLMQIPEGELSEALERMAHKGTAFTIEQAGRTEYCAIPFVPGIVEFQLMRAEGSAYERKLASMLEEFEGKLAPMMTPETMAQFQDMIPTPFARVIPVQKEVPSHTQIYPYEVLSEFIDREEFFAAAKCYCRHHADIMNRPCEVENAPEFGCMSFGDVARFTVKYGFSKEISREQAREILNQCEQAGLVHCTNNVSDLMTFICNCCGCCCGILRGIVKYNNPKSVAHSNFIVQATPEDCSGCGECVDRCQVQALTLEQEVVSIDEARCIGCGLCSTSCPTGCLQLVKRPEIIEPGTATDPFVGLMGG